VWSAWLVGLASVAWVTYLDLSYASTMPRRSDPGAGRTVPMIVDHGTHIFVSDEEAARLDRARSRMNVGVIFCAVGTIFAAATGKGRYE
jgi:hypothetical protein